jgi:hypothetical protein
LDTGSVNIRAEAAAASLEFKVGIAVRDITPATPIYLAGYASRNRAADKVDRPLMAQAVAFWDASNQPFILISLDNCEVTREFTAPVLRDLESRQGLPPGRVMIVSSHTHSGPILDGALETMYALPEAERERIIAYSRRLREQLSDVASAALASPQSARLEYGVGQASFAMNRRVFSDDKVVFGDNPDGPVAKDVPVLKISDTNGVVRAILFGYACHGTSIRTGDDFYVISGEYMAYAREHLEALHPGAAAVYLAGMGADCDPYPRGKLLEARKHGLELAGAIVGVLSRPMQTVRGPLRVAHDEVELPLTTPPAREQIEKDVQHKDLAVRQRADKYLDLIRRNQPLPAFVKLPVGVLRFGDDLTLIAMAGEPVSDYALRFRRQFARENPWMIGYAYEVPCYIPSARILLEGGYEADSSFIYYGLYGSFRGSIEETISRRVGELIGKLRNP